MAISIGSEKPSSFADIARGLSDQQLKTTVCSFNGHITDYATFDKHCDQIANGLIKLGVKPGDRIAVLAKNSDLYLELIIGTIRARATLVTVNWRLAPPEIDYILENSEVKIVFSEMDSIQLLARHDQNVRDRFMAWILDDNSGGEQDFIHWRDSQSQKPVEIDTDLDDDIVQMYTSGTTGRPKGVCLTHRNFLAYIDQSEEYQWGEITAEDRVFIPGPFFHLSGMNLLMRALFRNACLITVASFQPVDLPKIIESERISRTVMVPAVIQICLSAPDATNTDYSSLKIVGYGGSPITQSLLLKAKKVFSCDFSQGYGLTESTGVATSLHPDDHSADSSKLLSVGRALRGVDIRIVGSDGNNCATGEVGEILIKGPNVMRRYWRNEEATANTVVNGWLHTGDVGYMDEEHYLYIHDRLKDMIVSGGENVYPTEVENAIADHPDVEDVAVFGIPDERWGEAVTAAIVQKPGTSIDHTQLQLFLKTRIAGYKIPKRIELISELPRNASGKILRRQLRDPYWEGRSRNVG